MARPKRILQTVVTIFVIISVVSMGTAAQSVTRHVLFDTGKSELATVHTNGEPYVVYSVQNLLPYASGVEVYANGKRVTSKKTVDAVFRALARRKATKFQPERQTIDRLQRIINRSQTVQRATTESISALNDTLAYRNSLKETAVNDTTAWEAATETSDAVDDAFAGGVVGSSTAKEVRNQLLTLKKSATDLEGNAKRVIQLLRQRQDGEEINRSDLYRRYDALYADLKTIKPKINEVRNRLSTLAKTSASAASQTDTIPSVGDDLQQRFSALEESLTTSANQLSTAGPALAELRADLPQVATDTRYQAHLTNRWKKRQGAPFKVYVTVIEGLVVIAAGAIAKFED